MKIVFFSNFLNHHQLPLCLELAKRCNNESTFVATEKIPQERLDMQYEDMNDEYSFVLRSYESEEANNKALCLAEEADIAIIGSAPEYFIEKRLKDKNKLTFRFCERSFKKGIWRRFIPKTRKKIHNDYIQYKDSRLYILGSSAYTAKDLAICGFPPDKCYRWGYFPQTVKISDCDKTLESKKKNSIIWVGRFISLKHPETALKIAKRLKREGIQFSLKMVGDGVLKKQAENFVKRNGLTETVEFTGAISPEEVRKCMLESEIFLFTSDFYEGWGAVANEAMNSMCVPVVSHSCGSSPFLVNPGKNGYIFRLGKTDEALKYIKRLFDDRNTRVKLSREAYNTIKNQWNAETAAERLLDLSENLINGKDYDFFMSGPCSKAPLYSNNWYKGE